jgi:hypothetical protein
MKLKPADQKRYEAEITKLIQEGRMPSFEQVQAVIATTRQKLQPLILAARRNDTQISCRLSTLINFYQ